MSLLNNLSEMIEKILYMLLTVFVAYTCSKIIREGMLAIFPFWYLLSYVFASHQILVTSRNLLHNSSIEDGQLFITYQRVQVLMHDSFIFLNVLSSATSALLNSTLYPFYLGNFSNGR